MTRLPGILIFIMLFSCNIIAGEKSRTYNEPIDKVWSACVKAAGEKFTVEHTDKENYILTFKTGTSMTSWGMTCSVTLKKLENEKVKVNLNTQKNAQLFAWGAGGRIEGKYFKAVEEILNTEK